MLQILRKDLLEIELTKNIDFYLKAISYLLMSIFFYVCVFLNKFLFPPLHVSLSNYANCFQFQQISSVLFLV